MKIQIKSFWPAIVGLIAATILFCMPGNEFPEEDWFAKIFLDKWIHVGLFAGLVASWCLPFIHRLDSYAKVRSVFVRITVGFVLYGIAIEFIQKTFIPFRSFGVDDMVADAIGCFIGLWFSISQLRNQNFQSRTRNLKSQTRNRP